MKLKNDKITTKPCAEYSVFVSLDMQTYQMFSSGKKQICYAAKDVASTAVSQCQYVL